MKIKARISELDSDMVEIFEDDKRIKGRKILWAIVHEDFFLNMEVVNSLGIKVQPVYDDLKEGETIELEINAVDKK